MEALIVVVFREYKRRVFLEGAIVDKFMHIDIRDIIVARSTLSFHPFCLKIYS